MVKLEHALSSQRSCGGIRRLILAWEMRIQCIEIEIDSETTACLIQGRDGREHLDKGLIQDCGLLLRNPWNVRVMHPRRNGNRCADYLAELGYCLNDVLICNKEPPLDILAMLELDSMNL